MLRWLYNLIGFWGSILLTFAIFVIFIFWIAGMAGLIDKKNKRLTSNTKLFIAIFIPPVPIIWMIKDMFQQSRYLKSKTNSNLNHK